jgi:hypothetical protein
MGRVISMTIPLKVHRLVQLEAEELKNQPDPQPQVVSKSQIPKEIYLVPGEVISTREDAGEE